MSDTDDLHKQVQQTLRRAETAEAELNAVRTSKSYKVLKIIGTLRNKVKSDPVGLAKKVINIASSNPKRLIHPLQTVNRLNTNTQQMSKQGAKYQEWIILNEPDSAELDQQKSNCESFEEKPLISLVVPVFNPPVKVLEDMIESVLEQTYPHFELCLGNFGDSKEVVGLLEKYAKLDNRIKYREFDTNEGIAGNSNQILATVKGDYVALLDHDDALSPDALYENVKKLNEDDYDFIYSDKDKVDIDGNRFEPLFKPEWSPEMMLNINYLTHLNVMKTSILKKINGWDSETDGAQDWDLFLRVIEQSKKIAHIPKVLYHWRVIATSTAASIETKPYALAGQRRAIDKYLSINNIPAKSYHQKTELLLTWDKTSISQEPLVYIYFSNTFNTQKTIRNVRHELPNITPIVLVEKDLYSMDLAQKLERYTRKVKVVLYKKDAIYESLKTEKRDHLKHQNSLFIRDDIKLPRNGWYDNLAGWLTINGVAAASGRTLNQSDLIIDSGGIIGNGNYQPLFYRCPRFYQGYIGNSEWIRDLSIISSGFFVTKTELLSDFIAKKNKPKNQLLDDFFLWVTSNKQRLVLVPQVMGTVRDNRNAMRELNLPKSGDGRIDRYSNPNINQTNPLLLSGETNEVAKVQIGSVDKYQNDATILADSFDITEQEITRNRDLLKNAPKLDSLQSVAWFLPSYEAVYAGLMNIFRFANYLHETKGLKTTFYILKNTDDLSIEKERAIHAFPSLESARFVSINPDQINKIQPHDVGIATLWATAYPLAKTDKIPRKCYFIQDNEVNFYPKGTISSLVELSYKFGFTAIANTAGLMDLYKEKYGGKGFVVKSYVDLSNYTPREDVFYEPKAPYKVFFYARPNMPRNAFELGIAGLKKLKQQLGDKVEVITAGESWDANQYGVGGMFTNLGKINYEAVPKLYRSVDAGLMFMFSGHPGVTASELMASGCPVVVNEYDDVTWHELYKNGETCLTTRATASEVASNLRRLLEDQSLRRKLIAGGLEVTKSFYGGYEESCERAYSYILKH